MKIKNWSATLEASESIAIIRQELGKHGARKFALVRRGSQAVGFTFDLLIAEQFFHFRVALDLEAIVPLVAQSMEQGVTALVRQQAYRTAWANLRDHVASGLALVDSGAAEIERVFFPYLLMDEEGQETYFEAFQKHRLLPAPVEKDATIPGEWKVVMEG